MLNNIFWLTKIIVKNSFLQQFSVKTKDENNKRKSKIKSSLLVLLFVFLVGSSIVPIILAISDLVGLMVGVEEILVSFLLPVKGIMIVRFSVFVTISILYFSEDQDFFLYLPVKPNELMLAKLFASVINSYIVLFIFQLPIIVGIGIGIDANLIYYLYGIIIFIFSPLIPSVLTAILIMLVMKTCNICKNKDILMYLATFVTLVVAILYSMGSQYFYMSDINTAPSTIAMLEENVLPYLESIFPFYNSAADALNNFNNINGVFSLITFIGINIISVLLFYLLFGRLYLRGVVNNSGSNKKKMDKKIILNNYKKRSVFTELLKKEWLILKRTPAYMLNLIIILVIMPIIFSISILSTGEFSSIQNFISLDFYNDPKVFMWIIIGILFITSTSAISATSISREGSNLWFTKILPVDFFYQIINKIFLGFLIGFINSILILIIATIFLNMDILYSLMLILPLIFLIFNLNLLGIIRDLKKPFLTWNNETEAVKQNLNVLFSMLIGLFLCVILYIVIFAIEKLQIDVSILIISLIFSLINFLISAFGLYYISKNKNKLINIV